jgi:small-conductance mechanosensitive channel
MSFREKSAWISLVLILVMFGAYFRTVSQVVSGETSRASASDWMLGLVLGFLVLEVVFHLAIAIQSPRDARAPKDERERLISLKATRIAYFVLMIGALLSLFSYWHLEMGAWSTSQHVFLSIVFAEFVKFAAQIVFFRRGV